ncbi:MAG TPA: hypothetical protein VFF65_12945, partial [Phycisphaerales bacterium]|nr:hypothetical protein [Phycisphaerales bacterium]
MALRADTGLAEAVRHVRTTGRRLDIRCPLHDDSRPSLSVWLTRDGWVHYQCMRGCPEAELTAVAGLSVQDRAPANGNGRHGGAGLEILYDYTDEAGHLLFQVLRKPGKLFRQRRPDPTRPGEFIYRLDDVRRVLYRLPAVVAAVKARSPVWIVEGEKDVASCEARGLVATTNPGGAGKWKSEYSRLLAGADVTIVADKDEAGLAHAKQVANSLKAVGVRAWRIVTAARGKDATDHFDAGHTPDEFVLLHGSPPAQPRPDTPAPAALEASIPGTERRLTEGGNADRFVELFAEDVRYVDEAGLWFVWDGHRFQRDSRREVVGRAREVVAELYASAAAERDQAHRRNLADHAKRSDSAHAIRAMLDLAKADRAVARRM